MKYKPKPSEFSVNDQEPEYGEETVSIHEAKTNFSKLVKKAAAGEPVYIGSYGKPEVVLMAVNQNKINAEKRRGFIGCMKGKIPKGLDEPLSEDIIDLFYSMEDWEDLEDK
jgi:prevent-host-death family protein